MFKALTLFTDLQDNGYKYMPGDEYPRHGLKPTEDRIKELLTDKNRRHKPMIEEVEEKAEVEPVAEEKSVEMPAEEPTEKPKPKKKRAKKAPEGE